MYWLSALTLLLKMHLLHHVAWHSPTQLQLQSDVVTRRSYVAQVRQVAEDSNDEDTFRICNRFLAQTSTPRLVYGLMLMPMTVLLWRFLELLDVMTANGYLKPTLSLVDR